MAEKKYWCGTPPEVDDFGEPIKDWFVDGRTAYGPWGFMAPLSYLQYGVGLGLGRGQKYKRQGDGRWLKVGG